VLTAVGVVCPSSQPRSPPSPGAWEGGGHPSDGTAAATAPAALPGAVQRSLGFTDADQN